MNEDKRKSISRKIILPLIVLLVIVVLLINSATYSVLTKQLGQFFMDEVIHDGAVAITEIENLKSRAYNNLGWIEGSQRFYEALESGDREKLQKVGQLIIESLELEYMVITDIEGNVILRVHEPEKYGDNIANQVNIQKALKGEKNVGVEDGAVVKFSIRAGAPLRNEEGQIIGAVSTGYILSSNTMIDWIGNITGKDIILFDADTGIGSNIKTENGERFFQQKIEDPVILKQVLEEGKAYYGEANVNRETYIASYIPFKDANNNNAGVIFSGQKKDILENLNTQIIIFSSMIAFIAASVLFFVLLKIIKSIVKLLEKLSEAAEKIAVGDMDVNLDYKVRDEIGQVFQSFNKIIHSLKELENRANSFTEEITEGDLNALISDSELEGGYKDIIYGMNKIVHTLVHYIDVLPNPVMIMDKDMEIKYLNHAGASLVGLTPQEVKGKKCFDLFKTSHCNTENCACVRAMEEERQVSSETDAHPNGLSLHIGYSGMPIRNLDGKVIGAFESIQDLTVIKKAQKEAEEQAELVKNQIIIANKQAQYQERQVEKLIINLDKFSKGNLNISTFLEEPDEDTQRVAELYKTINQSLEASTKSIGSYIEEIEETLSAVANKDLTVGIEREYLGDFKKLKESINHIVNQLNMILKDIDTSAEQVEIGADQVASSSQSLAQGSSEQASAVEQISATITQIAEQTKGNAESAIKANKLSVKAKEDTEKGNIQMEEMLKAMNEIKDSSKNIASIIKVIDEIAFQTNILALNAAVEAARAGEHGKGFAVVAEEVRNLAARSAIAAKDTTELIDNSIRRVEDGYIMANITAEALSKIVEVVSDSGEFVSMIASSSKEQAIAISEINNGIQQIALVTQSNTATAEESASASQEMSGQAQLLKETISEFILEKNESMTSAF